MNLESVLAFIRSTDQEEWRVIIAEMNNARKRREECAARQFSIGNMVAFHAPDEEGAIRGCVLAISRKGRVVLECVEGQHKSERISVPATMLARSA